MVYFPLLPPVRVNIKRMMEERLELYHHVPLQDSPIPVEFNPLYAEESIPGGVYILEAVKCLHLERSGRPSGMQAEHLCQ